MPSAVPGPGAVERWYQRSGEAADESDEQVEPIEGVAPQRDPPIDHVEAAVNPEALLDSAEDQCVGSFGEHGVAAGRDGVKVDAEPNPSPLKRGAEEAIYPGPTADCRQRDVRVDDVVRQKLERVIELAGLEGKEERSDDLAGLDRARGAGFGGGGDGPILQVEGVPAIGCLRPSRP